MERSYLIGVSVLVIIIVISTLIYFQLNLKQPEIIDGESYYGILTVVTNCMIPEGCGPKYRLWDSEMKTYTPLLGDIKDRHSGLIVQVNGEETNLPSSEYNDLNYFGPTNALNVKSYKTLSKISYHEFLVKEAGEYTLENYPCLASEEEDRIFTSGNKEFSWEIEDDLVILKVKMAGIFSDDGIESFYELWYDGNSGEFIKEIKQPIEKNFCE